MTDPQPGLVADGLCAHHHVEFRIKPGVPANEVSAAVTSARRAATWVGGPNMVWGFDPVLWRGWSNTLPDEVQPFRGISGPPGLNAPSTQFDIWAWCSSYNSGDVARAAFQITEALSGVADLVLDLPAYKATDSRDPIGFIDGTENPLLDEALEIALFGGDSDGAGGSAVLVQKWVHNMPEFDALSLADQEDVIGRTRDASIQLPDSVMPETSHVSRNTLLDSSGEEQHIYRKNTPFETDGEVGTQFIGCTNEPAVLDEMLDRMFGVSGDGLIDNLTKFSTPVTGSYYFVPSVQALTAQFGMLAEPDDDDGDQTRGGAAITSTLRIGSLITRATPAAE